MTGSLIESRLALLRRAASAGHVSAATAEEKTALDELVEKDLIRDGQLTEAGWRSFEKLTTIERAINDGQGDLLSGSGLRPTGRHEMRDASHAAPKGLQGRSLCVRRERRQLRVAIRVRRRRQAQSLTSGRLRHSRRDRQHLVDAAPIQIDDFESPAFVVEMFSDLG
jgi:hypothetical protein